MKIIKNSLRVTLTLLFYLTYITAFGAPVIDQAQTNADGNNCILSNQLFAQSFTVGLSGKITQVDIFSYASGPDPDLTVSIHPLDQNGFPNDSIILGSATLSGPDLTGAVPGANRFVTFDLSQSNVFANVGDKLAYVISSTDDAVDGSCAVAWQASGIPNLYPNGEHWRFVPTGQWASPSVHSDMTFRTWVDTTALRISTFCEGFEPPMDKSPVTVKKNRSLPHKAQLIDGSGNFITDVDIGTPPVIQVVFTSSTGGAPIDVTADALSAGAGTEGNQFEYSSSTGWQFNLKTMNYNASGTYTITMESGDNTEYVIYPTCTSKFVVE